MAGLHHDGQAVGLGLFHDQVGQLHYGLFLDLGAAHDPVDQARVLGQADHVGVLVGHHADPDLADHRAEMVAAGAAHGDGPDDHELIQVLGVGELGDRRLRNVAALEHLVEVHLGHAACRVVRVVVALRVDDQAVEHALHLDLDLVQQLLQLAGFDELRDVVVGVEALARGGKALSDLDGDGRAFFVGRDGRHISGSGTGHVRHRNSERGGTPGKGFTWLPPGPYRDTATICIAAKPAIGISTGGP